MGNKESTSAPTKGSSKYAFNEKELASIKKIYDELLAADPSHKTIPKSALEAKFSENPSFGAKLYNWMSAKGDSGNIDFDSFARIIEIFTKDPDEYKLAQGLSNLERIEIFALASLEKFEISGDETSNVNLSYTDSIVVVSEMLNIFRKVDESDKDEAGARAVTNQIYENKQEKHDYNFYFYQLKDRMRFMNKMITYYFLSKFVDSTFSRNLELPKLDSPSSILTKQFLTLFWLNNPQFQKIEKLNLIYSLTTKGSSFNRLAYAITGYGGPTLFILKHADKKSVADSTDPDAGTCVFGAYSTIVWKEELAYQGTNETFIFSLLPKYKQFQAYRGDGGKNYAYFNTRKIAHSKYKVGLGFGGNDFANFRLWIDGDMDSQCYSLPDDETYEKGYIVRPEISKLDIQQIEVWGLGGEAALQQQERFRALEAEQIEKSRKVDKKAMLGSQFDKEILFEKTFAVANNKEER